jgi:hypothetical protein
MNLRHTLAASTISVIGLMATAVPSASAADYSCDDTVALNAAVVSAQQAVTDARAAFVASNRPLGRLISAKRHEARAELAQSRAALRTLAQQARSADTRAEAATLRTQIRAERRDLVEARNLLTFKRAMLAEIKADRLAARTAFASAKAALESLQELEDSCATTTTP